MGEDEQTENQFKRNGVQMINNDRGEGNLDDDYDIIDGVDTTPMDDIVSMDDDENQKIIEEEPKKNEAPAQS